MVTILVLLVEAVIIARTLSVGDLGLFAFFQASLALLIIVVDLGFKTSAAQLIARRTGPLQERATNGLMTIRFAAIGGISVLILLARVPLSRLFNAPGAAELFLLMPLVLLFASLDELEGSLLRGFGYFQRVAAANILRGASRLVISSLVLLVLGWGLTGLIVSWMVSYAASFAFQWIAVPVRRRLWFRWSWARPVIRFSFPLQVTRYLWFGVARTQTLILALLVGPIAVAFYEVAARIPQGFHGLLQALYAVYHPTVARHFSRHETQAASMLIRRSLRLFYLATILTAWGAVLFGEDIIVVLFGAQYEAATPAFVVLMLALSLSASADLFGYAITGLGRTGRSMSVNALRAAASVGGGFLLVPYFGFIGAAISIALAQLISAPLAWLHLHREGLPTFLGIHMRQLLLVAACVVGMILLPPLGIASRVILFLIFAVLAAAFLSISRHDFALVLPEKLLQRVWPKRLVPSQLESSGE
jgi:O-antigen/teichoic acid export membrane protein